MGAMTTPAPLKGCPCLVGVEGPYAGAAQPAVSRPFHGPEIGSQDTTLLRIYPHAAWQGGRPASRDAINLLLTRLPCHGHGPLARFGRLAGGLPAGRMGATCPSRTASTFFPPTRRRNQSVQEEARGGPMEREARPPMRHRAPSATSPNCGLSGLDGTVLPQLPLAALLPAPAA